MVSILRALFIPSIPLLMGGGLTKKIVCSSGLLGATKIQLKARQVLVLGLRFSPSST